MKKILENIFNERKTIWVPLILFLLQIIIEWLNDILTISLPPQFYEKNYFQFMWESGIFIPIVEEMGFRLIGIGFLAFSFLLSFSDSKEEKILIRLKLVKKSTIDLAKQGARFPYHIDLKYWEDRIFLLLLIISSFLFGISHIFGYGLFKFIPAFLMGILLGWLFLRYGILACISYHMIYNSIRITGGFFFADYGLLISYGLIPITIFCLILLFEYLLPVNKDFLQNYEESNN